MLYFNKGLAAKYSAIGPDFHRDSHESSGHHPSDALPIRKMLDYSIENTPPSMSLSKAAQLSQSSSQLLPGITKLYLSDNTTRMIRFCQYNSHLRVTSQAI